MCLGFVCITVGSPLANAVVFVKRDVSSFNSACILCSCVNFVVHLGDKRLQDFVQNAIKVILHHFVSHFKVSVC